MISSLVSMLILLAFVVGTPYLVYRFVLGADQKAQILLFFGNKKEAELELVSALDLVQDKERLLRVIKTVLQLQVKGSIPKLIKLLRGPDNDIRSAAAEGLGVFRDDRAINPLADLRFDKDRAVRMSVIWALSKHNKEVVTPILVDMIGEKDKTLRMIICDLLGDMGSSVIPRLEDVITCAKNNSENYVETIATVISILKQIDDKVCATILISLLKSESRIIREKSAETLGELFATQALEPLKELLNDESIYIRETAEKAIGLIENRGEDSSGIIQKSKEKTLIENSIAKFQGVSKHKKKKFALDAVYRLEKIGQPAVVDLIDALSDKDPDVQKYSIISLGLIRDPQAIEPLKKMAKSPNSDIAIEAKNALEKIKEGR